MNKFFITGYLTKDTQKKYDNKGRSYCLINLVDNGYNRENYLELAAFNNVDFYCENLKKGDKVFIEGYIKNKQNKDENNDKINYFINSLYVLSIEFFKPIKQNKSTQTVEPQNQNQNNDCKIV